MARGSHAVAICHLVIRQQTTDNRTTRVTTLSTGEPSLRRSICKTSDNKDKRTDDPLFRSPRRELVVRQHAVAYDFRRGARRPVHSRQGEMMERRTFVASMAGAAVTAACGGGGSGEAGTAEARAGALSARPPVGGYEPPVDPDPFRQATKIAMRNASVYMDQNVST